MTVGNGTTVDSLTGTGNNTVGNEKRSGIRKAEEGTNEEDEITLEDLAPDGGWGWMIALAMILILVSTKIHIIITS